MTIDLGDNVAAADVAEALRAGYTLPVEMYTDPAIFELERDEVFGKFWQFAGLIQDVAQPGDYFTYWSGRVPMIVTRDTNGELKGFVNVCRHRGSQIVLDERGSRKSIQCHYHAWTWNLDGTLRAAPGTQSEPGFCLADYPLVPIQVGSWGPFVFVNPDLTAPSLEYFLGSLPELVEATGLPLDRLRGRVHRTYDIAANWKIVVENYLECYHCPVAHPGFSSLIDVNDYHVEPYEFFSVQSAGLKRNAEQRQDQLYHFGEGVEEGLYAYIWPTFMVNVYPGPGNVSLNLVLPLSPDRTRIVYDFCFVDEVSEGVADEFVTFINQVQLEDTDLCESVQRGMSSGYWKRGKLILGRENGLQHFQRLLHYTLTGT